MTKHPTYICHFANSILAWISQLVTQKIFISVFLSLLHSIFVLCVLVFFISPQFAVFARHFSFLFCALYKISTIIVLGSMPNTYTRTNYPDFLISLTRQYLCTLLFISLMLELFCVFSQILHHAH